MKTIQIHHFQNLTIENAKIISNPLFDTKMETEDILNIVFIRDPYEYFDYLLFDHLKNKRSILFTDDITRQIKKLNSVDFLSWLDTVNFIPFYNPQTFQLDVRKRLNFAIENLERFDYVVPYEEIDTFVEHIPLGINIEKNKNSFSLSSPFSLSSLEENKLVKKFIEKDRELYTRTKELWELVKENEFKSLREIIEPKTVYIEMKEAEIFKGATGFINEKCIRGFALNTKSQESLTLEIYKNSELLCTTNADRLRGELIEKFNLSHGKCGFQVDFDKPIFKKSDSIDIIIVPENIRVPIVGIAKDFFEE